MHYSRWAICYSKRKRVAYSPMTIDYLDCNATTPVDPRVQAEIVHYFQVDFGNPASPHDYGQRAKKAIQAARDQIGAAGGRPPA